VAAAAILVSGGTERRAWARDCEIVSEEGAGTPRSKQSETPRDPSTYSKDDVRSLREDWSVRLMEGRLSQVDEESSGGRPVTEMPRAREFWLLERRKLAFDI
jgi:hypothetical protein